MVAKENGQVLMFSSLDSYRAECHGRWNYVGHGKYKITFDHFWLSDESITLGEGCCAREISLRCSRCDDNYLAIQTFDTDEALSGDFTQSFEQNTTTWNKTLGIGDINKEIEFAFSVKFLVPVKYWMPIQYSEAEGKNLNRGSFDFRYRVRSKNSSEESANEKASQDK